MAHIIEAIFDEIKHNYNIVRITDDSTIVNMNPNKIILVLEKSDESRFTFMTISQRIGLHFINNNFYEYWLCPNSISSVSNYKKLFNIIHLILDNDILNKNGSGKKKYISIENSKFMFALRINILSDSNKIIKNVANVYNYEDLQVSIRNLSWSWPPSSAWTCLYEYECLK